MADETQDLMIASEAIGRRGVIVVIREIDMTKPRPDCDLTLDFIERISKFRVERQWNRGKDKELLARIDNRERALGFLSGIIAGLKISNA